MSMKAQTRTRLFGAALLLPPLVILAVVIFYPLAASILLSFQDVSLAGAESDFVGLDNYIALFSSSAVAPFFWEATKNTFAFTIASTGATTAIGLLLALVLNRTIRGRGLFRSLFLLPWLTPWVAASLLFMWMLDPNWGVVNDILVRLGVIDQPLAWFGNTATAPLAYIILNVWKLVPFVTLMLLAGLQSRPIELVEAARIDGANWLQQLRYITLPHLRSVLAGVALISVIWNFQLFTPIWLITQGGPETATTTLAIYQYKMGFQRFDFGMATTVGTVWLAFLVLFSALWVRRFIGKDVRI